MLTWVRSPCITLSSGTVAPNVPIVQPGIYWIKITHPSIKIPAKYNTDSTLVIEIAKDTLSRGGITWTLSAK